MSKAQIDALVRGRLEEERHDRARVLQTASPVNPGRMVLD